MQMVNFNSFPGYIVRPGETGSWYGGGGGMSNAGRGHLDAIQYAVEMGMLAESDRPNVNLLTCMADEGGSTGDLMRMFGTQPVGDLRRNLAAAAGGHTEALRLDVEVAFNDRLDKNATEADYIKARDKLVAALKAANGPNLDLDLMDEVLARTDQLAARVGEKSGIGRHSLGNLVLTAYAKDEGVLPAIDVASQLLRARARVLPVTLDPHRLRMVDGPVELVGEHLIDEHKPIYGKTKDFEFGVTGNPQIYSEARDAILGSDYVIGAPGSHYTSRLAAEVIPGMVDALVEQGRRGGVSASVFNLTRGVYDPDGWCGGDLAFDAYRHTGWMPDAVIIDDASRPLPEGEVRLPYRPDVVARLGSVVILAPIAGGAARKDPNSPIVRSGVVHDGGDIAAALHHNLEAVEANRQPVLVGAV